MKPKVYYISGPMRNINYYNFAAFDYAKVRLEEQGYAVISPADIDRENGFNPWDLPVGSDWSLVPENFDFDDIPLLYNIGHLLDTVWSKL